MLGDALCSFNPIYGQGMSVALLQSLELQNLLAQRVGDLARSFFARAAKVVDTPWSIAVGNDVRMPETPGPRPASLRFTNWYISRLHRAAHTDPVCSLAFQKAANLLAPPAAIMRPHVALHVLRSNLRFSGGTRSRRRTYPRISGILLNPGPAGTSRVT